MGPGGNGQGPEKAGTQHSPLSEINMLDHIMAKLVDTQDRL